jgi:hypothetical protein
VIPLASGSGYTLPLLGPGTVIIFGIVLLPVYLMLAAWFVGDPRKLDSGLLGVTYLVGLTTALWTSLFVATVVIDVLFF